MDYLPRIETEARLLRAAAVDAGADAQVPTCPKWDVHRLISHLVRTYGMVVGALEAQDPNGPPQRAAAPPEQFPAALSAFDDVLSRMIAALRDTDPNAPAWHFSPTAARTAAFWPRRMAHETTVHRLDAQSAAGTDTPVDAEFAADGIDEVLTRLIQRNTEAWAKATVSGTVLFHAADAGRAWAVRLVAGQLPQTVGEAVTDPDASVVGLADTVYRAAWGRPTNAVISGDTTLLEVVRAG